MICYIQTLAPCILFCSADLWMRHDVQTEQLRDTLRDEIKGGDGGIPVLNQYNQEKNELNDK